MPAVLRVSHVFKDYESDGDTVRALKDISLEVEQGEFVALMGPSGCGKSTLLHILGAMDRPTAGEVWFQEMPLHTYTEEALTHVRRKHVGFVFQFFHLLPTFTVAENVGLPLLLGGGNHSTERVDDILKAVGLIHKRYAMPSRLSGGEMQRVAIARALVHRPRLLIADEPTGNLDSESGARALELLRQMSGSGETAIVMATHNEPAAQMAHRILRMRDGRFV
jgi:putative ABC transport system ATP-binding protein